MCLKSFGYVGIGTTSPSQKLDVNGSANITNNLTIGGNLQVNGTRTFVNTTNLDISDNLILLNRGTGTTRNDSGLLIEKSASTGKSFAYLAWDDSPSNQYFELGTTSVDISNSKGSFLSSTTTQRADLKINDLYALNANFTGNINKDPSSLGMLNLENVDCFFKIDSQFSLYNNSGNTLLDINTPNYLWIF